MVEKYSDTYLQKQGDIQNFISYHGIKLMIHTMKLWERVIDYRLRHETTISENPRMLFSREIYYFLT